MDPSDQIEVIPDDSGWRWQKVVDGDVVDEKSGYSDRASTISAARSSRGDEEVTLTRSDGSSAGTARVGGGIRVVLLRADGSLVGELDPPREASGEVQSITLEPAGENGEAVAFDG